MAERPLYTLYKNLKAQNYDVPDDYNKFESALTRDGKGGADNRHAIYENLKAQNFDVPSTYERFYSALFEPRSKTSSRAKGGSVPMSAADRARFSAGASAISASAQQTMNNAGRYNRLKQRKQKQQKDFGRVNLGTHQTPYGGDANNVVKDDFAYNPETGKAGAYVTSDNENVYSQNDAEQKQAILDEQNNAYQQAVDTGEIPSVLDVRDKNGNYDLQENIGKNGTYLTEEGAQKQFDKKLADAYARKKEIEAAIAEDHRLHGNPLLSYGASIGASNGRTAEQSDYSNKLATSLALVNEQIGALEAVKQYPTSSWGEDALKALDNTAFTAKTWDFGLTDFATMGQMERIKTKMDNKIPLSGSDKMLLKSKLGADAAAALEDEKMGNIYRWTKIAGQSLPFMADFFLTGGYGGITKGISRGALKFAAKRGMGKVGAAILKNTGIVAGDVIGSYAMAGTEQALKTGADIMQRHLGNLYQDEKGDYKFGTFDENGNLLHEGGESIGTALYKGMTSAMVENYTEKLFGHNYGIKKGAVNFMEKHGMNASAEFFKNIGKSGWYTNSKKWMEKFGINGFAEEVMEEEIGIPLHALLDGEGKVSDLLDTKQQLDIIGGMAISVGSMYAMGAGSRPVKGIYNRAQYYRFRNKVNVADSDAQNLMGDNWADIKEKIDNATNEQMGGVLADILRQRDTMTKEQINAAVNYGVNLMKMRGYNIAKTAEMNAKEITNEPTTPDEQHQADIDNAYSEGHDADDADKHDIQIQQEDQMKTLAAALGISEQQLSAMSDEELESLTGQDDKLDQAIYDYQLSSARYQGVVDDAQDKVDLAAHQAEQRVDMYTDQSRGSVRNATIKASGGLEDYGVYIISGNIATHEDGSIDVSNSDDMILYYDPTTNSVEHADALMFAELGEELPADDVKAQAVADAKENAIKEIAGIIDGTVEVGSQFNVTDTDGSEHTYEVLADYGDGTAAISIDGNVVENPYSLADLQQMKDLEDQKRLEAAKAQREQMEKERAAQQTQETEQTQPSFDFNQILNDNGNVVLVDVLDKDGNTKYPDSRLFLIRDAGAKAKVVELKSDGTIVPHAVNKEDVATISSMSLDEYKQAMPESSMIEDNSGENRGETAAPDNEVAAPDNEVAAPESAETPATEQTPAAHAMTLEDGTEVPMLEDGNPDFSKLTAEQTAELYDTQFGEDADSIVSGYVSDAKKALDKASNMTVKGKTFVEQKAAKDAKEKAIAEAQAAYDSAIAIRDAYNERQLAKVEDTAEGRKELIEKARRKFARLKSAVKDDAEAVSQLYRETIGSLLHRLYDSTGIDVTDTTPLTAEEYVASNLGAHSLNYGGTETSKGVKQETGLSREDFAKTQLLAADGKGTTIDALVHSLWENRPSNLESLDTQDIRNALIGVLNSGFKASEARNFVENIRIAQAENILEEQKRAQENAAYAEQHKAEPEAELKAKSDEKAELKAKSETKLDNESDNKSNDLSNESDNEKTNDKINDNINVPEDATDENPLGAERDESDLPFSAKENGKQQTTAERAADVEKNKLDDMKVVDNIVGQKTRKAFERLAKMMGANIQWQYSDKLGNGWIQETTDADGNVHRTIFITLDSSITEGAQFIFGHEMTHQIKSLNPAAYNELTQLVLDTYGSDAFDKAVDETMQRYSDAGFSGRARDYYAEEVVADSVGEMIRDLNLAHTLAMKMSHPLLAAIHEILQKIKLAFFGTEYSDVTKNIIRSIEQAYVNTANGQVTNSETGEDVSFSLRQKPEPKKKGVGYKVFVLKDGKLYPPMVANPDGAATPVGVWLDADAAPIAGESKTGRPQVKQGGKGTQGGSGKLAYRPGWHLGVVPYAIQFNRKDAEGNKTLFPKNFVFAEVEYAADVDYQEEARQEGINPSGKYQHSLAGLKHLPTDGYYMYRTNPNPETDPWVITGAMKVNRILTRAEQAELVKNAGREPQQIQEGDIVTDDVVNSINQEIADAPKFSLKVYHGSGADFTEFDFDHMGEGAGSQAFGWGGYVTSSEEIGKSYANLSRDYGSRNIYKGDIPLTKLEKAALSSFIENNKNHEGTIKEGVAGLIERQKALIAKHPNNPLSNSIKKRIEVLEGVMPKLDSISWDDFVPSGKNLYEVDIPDDNGSNYIEFYEDATPEFKEQIKSVLANGLPSELKKMPEYKEAERKFYEENGTDESFEKSLIDDALFELERRKSNGDAYNALSVAVGDKLASKILSSLGYTGIKYPAGTIMGGVEGDETNYVIFKPEDMKITEHTKFSIKTYHGSQASFDKFDHSFMGSGEGAQAYGWGTYVSEVEGIAKAYAKQNAARHGMPREYKIAQLHLNHAKYEYDKVQRAYDNSKAYIDSLKEDLQNYRESIARRKEKVAYFAQNNMPEAVDKLLKQIKRTEDTIKVTENDINMRTNDLEGWKPKLEEVKKKYEEEQKKFDAIPKPQIERNLYSVDIPDDNGENYIGWDEKMTPRMRDIRKEILEDNGYKLVDSDGTRDYFEDRDGKEYDLFKEKYKTGGTFYEELAQLLHSQKLASLALKEYGFDGVKVIAERNTGGNKEGKMNYVIFDENNAQITSHTKFSLRLKSAIDETETNPSDAQKESGNYKKGHIKFGGYDYTIENPKGSTRSGKNADGKEWKVTMHDTYGYIRGKFGKDGDHLDMFINDKADLDNWNGDVFVVDQVNPDGSFDEHKVMYGYDSIDDAKKAYLANYSDGWQGLGNITGVSKDEFDKWLDTSKRKLKPFADYAKVKFSLKSKPVRFEAGKKLSDEEKKEVLSTLKDAYKVNGVPYHIEETAGGKEKRVYEPTADSYVVSDITNRPLRYYITLPDGRVAHPTEVYPNISDNEVKSSATKQGLLDEEVDQIVSAAIGNMKDIADNAKAIEVLIELQNLPHETHDVGYGMNNAQSYNYKTGIFTSDAAQAIDYVVRRMRRKEDVPAEIPVALKKAVADSYGMVDNLIDGMSTTKFSLKKEGLTPEIANTPVNIVSADKEHGFKNYAEAREWAKKNIVRTYNDEETGGKGEINISNTAVGKYLSEKAVKKSANKDVHMSVLKVLPSILRESVDAIQHVDRNKVGNERSEDFGVNPDVMIHRCYGAVNIGDKVYGVKITLKENVRTHEKTKLYSYEATKIELLDGQSGDVAMTSPRNSNNSITVAKIIKGFETTKKNGEKIDVDGTKFSLKDEEYLKAVEDGNMEKAQKMVNEAADAAGYSTDSSYQGTSAFNGSAPWGNGYFLTKEERKEAWDNGEFEGESTLGDYINDDIDGGNLEELTNAASYRAADPMRKEAIDNVRNAIQKKAKTITMYRSVPSDVKEGSFRNGDWVTPSRAYAVDNAKLHGWGDNFNIIEQKVPVDEIWWDGNDIAEWGYGREEDYVNDTDFAYKNTKNNRKLLDAVTYDDNGNVIPLSQRFNEKNKDVRYSLKDEKTMFGMHNISLDKLRKAIKQGGFAAPSMGVIDSKNGIYSGYGEITLIPKAEKIAKRTGKNIGTYAADAWTPIYPPVEKKFGGNGSDVAYNDIESVPKEMQRLTRNAINSFMDGREANGLAYLYLQEKGKTPELVHVEGKYPKKLHDEVKSILGKLDGIYSTTDEQKEELLDLFIREVYDGNREEFDNDIKKFIRKDEEFIKKRPNSNIAKNKQLDVDWMKEHGYDYGALSRFVDGILRDAETSGKVDENATMKAAQQYIQDNSMNEDFDSWKEKLNDRYNVEEVIFAGYKPDGNRKYLPNTVENAVKVMKQDGKNASVGSASFSHFVASILKPMGTLDQIRKKKGNLTGNYEDVEKFQEKWQPVYDELADKMQPDAEPFESYGMDRLEEAATQKNPKKYAKDEYGVDLTDEDIDKLNELIDAVKNEKPSIYFETKFMRPYGLDEFEKAIVPSDTPSDVVDALKKAGIDVSIYERGNAEDRQKVTMDAINSSGNIRFSLKSMMAKPEGWKQANKKAIHIAEAIERDPKFSLKNLDSTLIKAGTYFSGGGLVEEGLKGIIDPVLAVEYDEKISGVYRNNFGQHIVTADVRDVDPKELVKQIDGEVEYFHASPVCKNYSQAKSNHAEVELDKETAASTAEFINAVKPKVVTIENVKGYKDSEAMKTITDALDANGYTWDADVYNAADYGGYTNRERLIVRAVRDGKLPAKPKKMAHKSGWYEAVADIIPTLTEKKNGVAPWMDVRLKADGIDWRNIDKPLYVMGSAYADGKIPHAFADELLPTLRTKSGDVIVMPDGKVYRAMGRVLARVSGVSDDYKMPFSENLSHTIIGNGIPTQLTEYVIAPLLQNTLRPTTPEDGNTKFSLRYDQFEHDLNQWKKDNNLPKDAQRPTIPQRNAGESAVDFLKRVDEYRKQMALWKTAPTYEQHLLSNDTALGEFNRELQRGSVLKRIAFQDSMLAIRKTQEAIMKEVGVDRLNMAEDAYTAENRSHGKGKNEFEEYNNEFLQPLRKAYHQMKKVLGDSYDNVRIYMMAKHGLERDAQMAFKKSLEADYKDVAQRSAAYKAYKGDMNRIINDSDLEFGRVDFTTWRQRDNALRVKYSPSYMDYRYDKNGIAYDYSGLSALFDGSDFEEAAHKLVKDIESKYVAETHDLWDATNAATKKILRDGYKAGMMSKDTYQYVRDMYSHYIPLRGWDGTTADQVWDYIGGGKGAFNQTLKKTHGRTSIADDPIAYIENMAESGILLNNKNWVKQHLMLLAQNHPTSLLTLSKAWYVKSVDDNGNEEWIPATPQITSQMDSNQVKAAIDAFEKKMEQMAQTGDATQKRDGLNIAYPQTHSEEREHEVRVMKDGEEYVIYVNGDPQLAQAMNNTRAHRVREIQSGKLDRAAAWLGRKMAAAYTSLSPLFIPSNYFRDLTMTLASTAIREDAKYNYLLRKNLATSWNLGFILRDYQNGKLRDKVNNGNATPKEQMFYDFMMNGGETGFVSSLDVEDLKKKFKNDLKDLDRWKTNPVKVGHTIMDCIEFLNRAIEDSNRFAVYMTSIQYGRSIDEAVNDAKDVTLNFNRKGTGEYGWQMIRNLYLFINPAVQSLQTLGALAKHHPFKFTAVTASWLASGVLVPIVNAALMSMLGGDDDKDKYWQFTKWDRRNNLIMWVPFTHEYIKIPLAQEFRAFYGIGDMIASKMMGGELAEESWSQYAEDLLGQVVDMLPLDPTGYDGNIAVSLMPNAIRPVFELAFNVDFTGKPLFKETEYNKYDPNFTKAYVGTPDWLVRASRMMNSIGNDYPDVQQNSIDAFGDPRYNLNNPAVVDHVLSSYLGGAYTMGSQVLGVLTKSLNDPKEIKVADIPLFSKFVSNPDDRPVTKKQGDEFWNMKENHDRAANTLSKLKKQAKVDGDYSMLERFYGSEEYKQYKQDDAKVKKYEEDKKKERAEESGEEYRPHKLNAEDIYKAHATPKDDFEDLKLKQLYTKLNGFKTSYDLLVDTAPSQSDGYYNTNKAAIDAIDEISLDKQEISELKKGFLDDGKDAYNAEDMKQIRDLRKKILAVLEKANKVVVAKQKAKAEK